MLIDPMFLSITSFAESAGTVLEALLIAAAAIAVWSLVIARSRDQLRPRVVLGTFGDGAASGGFGAAFEQDLQVAVKALEGGASVRAELATGDSGDIALPPAAITALPEGTVISGLLSLLDLLYPPRDLTLDGCLLPDDGNGVGVWLRLSSRVQSIMSTVSLRHGTYARLRPAGHPANDSGAAGQQDTGESDSGAPGADANAGKSPADNSAPSPSYETYALLLTPAAVWLAYHIRAHLPRIGEPDRGRAPYPFGVKSWASYAFAAAGAERHAEEDPEFARRLYLEALALDRDNRLALLNLAVLDIRLASARDDPDILNRACKRLSRVLEACDEGRGVPTVSVDGRVVSIHRDGLWFRATYNLACARVVSAATRPREVAASEDDAQLVLAGLVRQLAAVLKGAPVPGPDQAVASVYRSTMAGFAEDLAPQVLVMAAGLARTADTPTALAGALRDYFDSESDVDSHAIVQEIEAGEPDYRARYNIACYYSRLGSSKQRRSREQKDAFGKALRSLRAAAEVGPMDIKKWAYLDPALAGIRAACRVKFEAILGPEPSGSE